MEGVPIWRGGWRSALEGTGVQYAMMNGTRMMQMWPADSWDTQTEVGKHFLYHNCMSCFSGAKALVKSEFGGGSGPIFLDDLQCTGTERSLFKCVTLTDCDHGEDAGLVCQNNGETIFNSIVL